MEECSIRFNAEGKISDSCQLQ